jgi:hypothetical protein
MSGTQAGLQSDNYEKAHDLVSGKKQYLNSGNAL